MNESNKELDIDEPQRVKEQITSVAPYIDKEHLKKN